MILGALKIGSEFLEMGSSFVHIIYGDKDIAQFTKFADCEEYDCLPLAFDQIFGGTNEEWWPVP